MKALADVGAADAEVLAVVGAAAHEDVDVGTIGVPVIDRDPIELRAEIAFGVVGARIEHPCLGAVAGDAFALQICDVLRRILT